MESIKISQSALSIEDDGTVLRLMQSKNGLTKYAQRVKILSDEEYEKIEQEYPGSSVGGLMKEAGFPLYPEKALFFGVLAEIPWFVIFIPQFLRAATSASTLITPLIIILIPMLLVTGYTLLYNWRFVKCLRQYKRDKQIWELERHRLVCELTGYNWKDLSFDVTRLIPGTMLVVPQSATEKWPKAKD